MTEEKRPENGPQERAEPQDEAVIDDIRWKAELEADFRARQARIAELQRETEEDLRERERNPGFLERFFGYHTSV